MADYKKPTADGSKKGKFVGDPAKIHIHIVKGDTHIKVAGKRTDFSEDAAGYKKALTALGDAKGPGAESCKAWLEAQ